jgi:dGTPase
MAGGRRAAGGDVAIVRRRPSVGPIRLSQGVRSIGRVTMRLTPEPPGLDQQRRERPRGRDWSDTMSAHPRADGVSVAHEGAPPMRVGPRLDRAAREAAEIRRLAKGATRAQGAGRRAHAEPPDPVRTCFERDRDRILHAAAFRRLAGKTQVFVFPADHQRTRLTHALEVAQVARSIATTLRLNVPLTEAIALGHDCGHGPGGHASEEAFGPYLAGGFDHAVWGADVVLEPLNLCVETLDGIRNHSWSRPTPSTPEGEVVAWADRIAYVCHDFEDAVSAGVVTADDLPEAVRSTCGPTRSAQIDAFIAAVVDGTIRSGRVAMRSDAAEALAAFRAFDYERVYLRPDSVLQAAAVIRMLRALVEHLAADPWPLPCAPASFEDDPLATAVRHVAGMTDRFACQSAVERLGWPLDELPRGVDLAR